MLNVLFLFFLNVTYSCVVFTITIFLSFPLPSVPCRSIMLLAQILLFLGLCIPSSLALNATVCDCTKPLHMGILQFSDEDCRPEEDHSFSLTVKYSLYTTTNYVPDGRSKNTYQSTFSD